MHAKATPVLLTIMLLAGCDRQSRYTTKGERFVEFVLNDEKKSTIVCKSITVWPEGGGKYGMEYDGSKMEPITVHGATSVSISPIPASEGHPCQGAE